MLYTDGNKYGMYLYPNMYYTYLIYKILKIV